MFRRLKLPQIAYFYSNYATRVEIDPSLRQNFDAEVYKPRKHPGKVRIKVASIPPDIQKAIKIVLDDNNAKSLYEDSLKLRNYLDSRLLPPEEGEINQKAARIYRSISKQEYTKAKNPLTQQEQEDLETKVKTKVYNALKKKIYSWANISYDTPTGIQYLMARAAPDYAVLVRVLDEIRKHYPDYKPRSFFDFGSGVGTGTWAMNTFWPGDIFEYYCVDTSPNMHDLARLILCHGKDNVEMPIKGYYQRQFLPASTDLKYNIVLSAYTLFELPSMKSRLETIQKLWNKTEDFLIIIENGSNAGFQVVNEAREFILNQNQKDGYAFSPCPNDNVCPRYLEQETPCNFLMKFEPLPFPNKSEVLGDVFSYVIMKKGVRSTDDPQWPRVVRAPIVRSGHTICRLCTKQGELKEVIFSKSKHDKTTYRCARSSTWGDSLPIMEKDL